MLAKRIIPCLDIKDGRTVKGVNFVNLRDAGDPVELGAKYSEQGADELVFLDITATHEKRKTMSELARNIARRLNIPFTIGGGVSSIEDADALLAAGADKVSINSAAVRNPQLIDDFRINLKIWLTDYWTKKVRNSSGPITSKWKLFCSRFAKK
jgi:cyclase